MRSIKPLPYRVYFSVFSVLALTGLVVSGYLVVSHARNYLDMTYTSFCAVSESINCDTVSQSPYSIIFSLPVPVWASLGYLFILALAFMTRPAAKRYERYWSFTMAVLGLFCLYSLVLAMISIYSIRSLCIMCMLLYAVNLFLLFQAYIIRKRFSASGWFSDLKKDFKSAASEKKSFVTIFSVFFASVLLLFLFFPRYWEFDPPPLSRSIPKGITKEGHPWLGATEPILTITEFSDYQCFQCNKMHYYLRRLIDRYPDKIRLVHRHFPMDDKVNPLVKKPLHVRAGGLAMLAIFAAERGRFWEMNDILFDTARRPEGIDLSEIAAYTGISEEELKAALKSPRLFDRLRTEIREAIMLGVNRTPTFLIEGRFYSGRIPPEIIKRITG